MTKSSIKLAYEQYLQSAETSARAAVEEGGGIWIGIQSGGKYDLALFNSPKTGSTLGLRTSEVTPELVRAKIKASDKAFKTTRRIL